MKNNKLISLAVLNALGTTVYIFLVSLVLNNAQYVFGPMGIGNRILSPIAFLLLFIFSALLTGFLILGRPVMLYLDGQKKEGLKLLFYTGGWLFIFMLIFFVILVIVK